MIFIDLITKTLDTLNKNQQPKLPLLSFHTTLFIIAYIVGSTAKPYNYTFPNNMRAEL